MTILKKSRGFLGLIILASLITVIPMVQAKATTTLVLWDKLTADSMEMELHWIDAFEATHPGTEVEHVSMPTDYYNKLSVAIAAGVPPDVAQLIPTFSLAEFAEGGLIQPLDTFVQKAGIKERDFFPLVWDSWHYDGSIWAMTYDVDPQMLFTNRSLFAATGVSLPNTIEELDEAAKRLTLADDEGNVKRMGFVPWLGDWCTWFAAWDAQLWDAKAGRIVVDNTNAVSMFAWMASYSERYGYARINALTSRIQNYHRGEPLFTDQLGALVSGPWVVRRFGLYAPEFEWDMLPLPYAASGKPDSTTGNALTLTIPVGAKHPQEAFEYIRWRTSQEHMLDRVHVPPAPGFPARVAVARAYVQRYPEFMPMANALAGPNSRPYLPTMPVSVFLSGELTRARNQVIQLQSSPRGALDAVTKVVQARLDEVLRMSRRSR
ncbi:MAG: extracellular solute-binding protein [Limnochordia bacterium]|jgi:multiple sugar transport system substrate-binding protein